MSLVAYGSSSDENSDNEEIPDPTANEITIVHTVSKIRPSNDTAQPKGIITEDDILVGNKEKNFSINRLAELLPKPKNCNYLNENLGNSFKPNFTELPTPKTVRAQLDIEEDDIFLLKKSHEQISETRFENVGVKKIPAKISIPSLKNFKDVEKEIADKARKINPINHSKALGSSELLSILPKPKAEQNFGKVNKFHTNNKSLIEIGSSKASFVPDSVKYKRPATNTEDVESLKPTNRKFQTQNIRTVVSNNDSDESDDNSSVPGDFFSFNNIQNLPEVSTVEINDLVAKKAAKIVETASNFLMTDERQKCHNVEQLQAEEHEAESSKEYHHQKYELNTEALQALVGRSKKRRCEQKADIQVIDINSSEVLPNKEEWMRTALASSTSYQPTGVLIDEEPASGTRRKHQITYLAHKAKANEAELQAMWSANRQNRRATQSKYGF